jgi:hypothetical protein
VSLKDLRAPARFFIVNAANEEVTPDYPVIIASPDSYARATAKYYPGEEKKKIGSRFEVTVTLDPKFLFFGPACRVDLDLRPERIERLIPQKQGRFGGSLASDKQKLILEATNLTFEGGKNTNGFVYLTVDGYRRAYVYDVNFYITGTEGTVPGVTQRLVRLAVPRYAQPSDQFPVTIEADGISRRGRERLRLGVLSEDKKGEGDVFTYLPDFTEPRSERLRFAEGPRGGTLVFHPEVKDWSTTLDLSGIVGPTKLQLLVVDEKGEPQDVRDGNLPGTTLIKKAVVQEIVLDDSPPDQLVLDATRPAYRGKNLAVRALAADAQSGIASVLFYLGKPIPDGKLPPDTVRALGKPGKKPDLWVAELPVAADQKSPLPVSVLVTNRAGLSATKGIVVNVEDAPPTSATISGQLFEEETPVGNLPVGLLNAKNKAVQVVRAGPDGKFTFTEVEKGVYRLYSRRPTTGAKGLSKPLTIAKGNEQLTDIELVMVVPGKGGKKARIEGTVVEGPRAQAGITVSLTTPGRNPRVLTTTKTDEAGKYAFADLDKGTYRVVAAKSASRTRAGQTVTVNDGEQKTGVDLKLYRR